MRKTFLLALVLMLALGLVFSWADQSQTRNTQKQQIPNDVQLQGVDLNAHLSRPEAEVKSEVKIRNPQPELSPAEKERLTALKNGANQTNQNAIDELAEKEREASEADLFFAQKAAQKSESPVDNSLITVNILSEGFEGGALPAGWSDNPGTSPWLYDGGTTHGPGSPHTGSYAAYYNIYNYSYDVEDSLVTPSMDLSAYGGFYQLSFWTWHYSGSDSLVVYLSEEGTLTRLFRMAETSSWTQNIVTFNSSSTDAKIYFIGYSRYGAYNIYLDDVSLDEVPADDIAAISIDQPLSFLVVGSTSDVEGTVSNLGTVAQTFDVTMTVDDGARMTQVYTSTVTGVTVNPGENGTVDFDQFTPSAAGDFTFTMTVSNPDDENTANDVVSGMFTAYAHDGEGGPDMFGYKWIDNTVSSGDAPVYNWVDATSGDMLHFPTSQDDGYTNIELPSAFQYYGESYDSLFVSTNGFVSFNTSYTLSYPGNSAIPTSDSPNALLAVLWDDMVLDTLTHPAYTYNDIANNRFVIEYDNAQFYSGEVDDTVDFEIILDYTDYSILYQYRNFDANYQTDITVGIENAAGDDGLEYFYSSTLLSNPTDYPYDGLAIKFYYIPPSVDVGVVSIDSPVGNFMPGDQTLTATLENLGDNSETFDVLFEVTDASDVVIFSETVNTTLAPGTGQVSASNQWNAAAGAYTVTVTTEHPDDGNSNNDSASSSHFVYDNLVDFEADNGHFTGYGDWAWGAPTSGPNAAFSGINCWATNLDGDYTNTVSDLDVTLTLNANAGMAIMQWYLTETNYDGGKVQVDDGSGFVNISPSRGYDLIGSDYGCAPGDSLFSGSNHQAWELAYYDLSAFSGNVTLRFEFCGDGSVFYPGWYVDNLMLANAEVFVPSVDVAFSSIDEPTNIVNFAGDYTIAATFENLMTDAVTLDSVVFQVFDSQPVEVFHDVITGSLDIAGFSTAQFSSATQWNATTDDFYAVYATSYLSTDGQTANDSGGATRIIKSLKAYPFVENFETVASDVNDWVVFYDGPGAGVYLSNSKYHSPTTSIYFNYSPYPRQAWLISPPIFVDPNNVSTNAQMEYYEAQSYWGDDPDETHGVFLMTGEFGLDNLDTLLFYDTSRVIPSNFEDNPIDFDISAYEGDTVWVVFEFNAVDNGANWYIDDVSVSDFVPPVVSIYDIQHTEDVGSGCYDSPFNGQVVQTSGVVTAITQGSSPRYFIQDCATSDWNGVYVYDMTELALGDQITFNTQVYEYYGVTELQYVSDLIIDASDVPLCTLTVTSDQIGDSCDADNGAGEAYEGMLVKLENVTCVTGPDSHNIVYVKSEGATDSCAIDDELYKYGTDQPEQLVVGQTYTIVGVVYYGYDIYKVYPRFASDVTLIQQGYQYLPGDANMYNGAWPPSVIGSDVTYLVNFFRGLETNPACNIDGNYMAADVNASCTIIGSDVTRLVNFFRGSGEIEYCPDWEPVWHNQSELPENAPDGWPNCEAPTVTGKQTLTKEITK